MARRPSSSKTLRIAIGADHAGFPVKEQLKKWLVQAGIEVVDMGTTSLDSTDYPDYAFAVARAVAAKRCDRGILACGTGIGMCIAANKVRGVRAAVVWSVETATLAAEHNRANVLCVSGRFSPIPLVKKMVRAWLATPSDQGERHERRIKKILKFESK